MSAKGPEETRKKEEKAERKSAPCAPDHQSRPKYTRRLSRSGGGGVEAVARQVHATACGGNVAKGDAGQLVGGEINVSVD